MMLCAIRGNARRKTNNYHFNTEDRKIIWLENTQWHMLSSISVALTQKLIPHEAVARRAVLMAIIHLNSSYFIQWCRHSLISPNICTLHMKLLHAPSSQYPHTYGPVYSYHHIQKLLLLQDCDWSQNSPLCWPQYTASKGEALQDNRLWCFVFLLDCHRADNQGLL